MKHGIGVVDELASLKELREADGCDEQFYARARSESLEQLTARPDVRWSGLLPNFTTILQFIFLALVFAGGMWGSKVRSLAVVIPVSLAGSFVVWLCVTYMLRRERLRKAAWSRMERLAELERLRERGLVTQEEHDKVHKRLMEFV